jgi:hypothetical protein
MENNKYEKGKIYKIVDSGNNKVYYGSTIKALSSRFKGHVKAYEHWKAGELKTKTSSFIIFDEFGVDNCMIELVLEYPCNSRTELLRKEGEYIRRDHCVNKSIAGRTKKQYRADNKEKIKQYRADNRAANKEKLKQYRADNKEKMKQYRADNKEKIKQYRADNKEKMKQYRADNKEKYQKIQRNYRAANKEKLKQYRADYRAANKEKLKQYRADNKEKIKQYR